LSEEIILRKVQEALGELPGNFERKKEVFCLDVVIAERKAFLSKQKLSYTARFRVDEAAREVSFNEKLEEQKSGFGAGGIDDISPGFSFKKTSTKSTMEGLEGVIDEQSTLFGKQYSYTFDYKKVRAAVKQAAESEGYSFRYKIWGKL
jgi:hypothetical protein